MKRKFLVVFQDETFNKHYVKAKLGYVGTVAVKLARDAGFDDVAAIDVKRLNSKSPYQAGTFGRGFYDIDVFNENQDCGVIMIFAI